MARQATKPAVETIADPGDLMNRARRLAALRSAFADRILDAEQDIINRMHRDYRGDSLTPRQAYGYVAELAALEGLLNSMEADAKRAEQEGNV